MKLECAIYLLKIIMYLESDLQMLWDDFVDLLQNMACLFSPAEYITITRLILEDFNNTEYKQFINQEVELPEQKDVLIKSILLIRLPVYVEWLCGIVQKLDGVHLKLDFLEDENSKISKFQWNDYIEQIIIASYQDEEYDDIMCDKMMINTILTKVESLRLEQCSKIETQNTQYNDDETPLDQEELLQYQSNTTQNNLSPKDELLNHLNIIVNEKYPSKHLANFLEVSDKKNIDEIEFKDVSNICEKL